MDNRELVERWLSVFGRDVDKKMIADHVTSYGNLLWYLFTWGKVPCFKGDEARDAFVLWIIQRQLDFMMDTQTTLKVYLS